jgi:hypothetical protein
LSTGVNDGRSRLAFAVQTNDGSQIDVISTSPLNTTTDSRTDSPA